MSVRVFRKCKRHDSEVKNLGTLRGRYQFLRALFLTNCVCRHRWISITYVSLLPCHGTAKWCGRDRDGIRGSRMVSEANNKG